MKPPANREKINPVAKKNKLAIIIKPITVNTKSDLSLNIAGVRLDSIHHKENRSNRSNCISRNFKSHHSGKSSSPNQALLAVQVATKPSIDPLPYSSFRLEARRENSQPRREAISAPVGDSPDYNSSDASYNGSWGEFE